MHNSVFMAVLHPGQAFIVQSHGLKTLFGGSVFQWNIPTLAKFLGRLHRLTVKTKHFSVLVIVEHWHDSPAPPAPEMLHGLMIAPCSLGDSVQN
jgi:hypothetical protein